MKKTTNNIMQTVESPECSPKETSGILQGAWTDNEAQQDCVSLQ